MIGTSVTHPETSHNVRPSDTGRTSSESNAARMTASTVMPVAWLRRMLRSGSITYPPLEAPRAPGSVLPPGSPHRSRHTDGAHHSRPRSREPTSAHRPVPHVYAQGRPDRLRRLRPFPVRTVPPSPAE